VARKDEALVQDNPNPGGPYARPDLDAMYRIGGGLGADLQDFLADALRYPAAMLRPNGLGKAPPSTTATQRVIDLRLSAAMAGIAEAFSDAAAMYGAFSEDPDPRE
jgi:hypothetical protein